MGGGLRGSRHELRRERPVGRGGGQRGGAAGLQRHVDSSLDAGQGAAPAPLGARGSP
jgi:hypothetical protein